MCVRAIRSGTICIKHTIWVNIIALISEATVGKCSEKENMCHLKNKCKNGLSVGELMFDPHGILMHVR